MFAPLPRELLAVEVDAISCSCLTRTAGCRHLNVPALGPSLAIRPLAPLFRCPARRCQTKGLGEIKTFGETKILGETKTLGDWPANLGKYQPANAGGYEKGSDRVVASLFCQNGQNVICQVAGIHGSQQVAHHGSRRDVRAQIGNSVGKALAGSCRLAFKLCCRGHIVTSCLRAVKMRN